MRLNQTQWEQLEIFQAVALYSFNSENDQELNFERYTIINVHVVVPGEDKSNLDKDWWYGLLTSNPEKRGFFPKNFVTVDDQTRRKYQLNLNIDYGTIALSPCLII